MAEAKHTPGPWSVKRGQFGSSHFVIYGPDDFPIAQTIGNSSPEGMARTRNGTHEANAEHIVQCVNSRGELLAALQLAVSLLRKHADTSHLPEAVRFDLTDWDEAKPIFAAIAKATGSAA